MYKISATAPWCVSIYFRWEGSRRPYRERRRLDVASKTAATHWAKARIAYLLAQGEAATVAEKAPPPAPEVTVPTLREFGPRWIEGYARAKRQKPSGIDTKESILRIHLYPAMGDRRLDEITDERVARFQASLVDYSRKTLNNILSVLGKLLRVAVKWKVIAAMPCAIELTKNEKTVHAFYDADAVRRLIDATRNTRERVLVLLGVQAGLRRGEMCGLRWIDVDFTQRQIVVRQSVWRGIMGTPKSGHGRVIDLSAELEQALLAHRHRRPMVLCAANGADPTPKRLRDWLADLQERAGLPLPHGGLHVLRHSFCSNLAALGAPAKSIQELAGHSNLSTTLGYMHLSPATRRAAIGLFDVAGRGTGVATLDRKNEIP